MNVEMVEKIMKALADRSRLLIIRSLIAKPQYLEELSERLGLAVSTVSFHLKKMEEAGIVTKDKQQYYTIFGVKKDFFAQKLEDLMDFETDEKNIQEERIRQYKEKVLKTFMQDGRIIQIPSQMQKRWIVFEQILQEFEYGKEYTEQQVNELIRKYHDDHCLIRRSFIEERVMNRENNIYTITENYENFRQGQASDIIKHGMKESYEQCIRDKFGVNY